MTINFYNLKSPIMATQYNGSGDELEAVRIMVAPRAVTVNFDNQLVIDVTGETCEVVPVSHWVIKTIGDHVLIITDKQFKEIFQEK